MGRMPRCLCRNGWFPLLVAPLVSCACLLELSSTGCDFIRIHIGFVPANDVWSSGDSAQLGLFGFVDRETESCRSYSEDFSRVFIASDEKWHLSQIMAYVSGIAR